MNVLYAGFWRRFLALLVDVALFVFLLVLPVSSLSLDGVVGPLGKIFMILVLGVVAAVLVVIFWMFFGATLGKMLVGVIVVDSETCCYLSLGQCLYRLVGYFVNVFMISLGAIWFLKDPEKKQWHDRMAKTIVVFADGGVG